MKLYSDTLFSLQMSIRFKYIFRINSRKFYLLALSSFPEIWYNSNFKRKMFRVHYPGINGKKENVILPRRISGNDLWGENNNLGIGNFLLFSPCKLFLLLHRVAECLRLFFYLKNINYFFIIIFQCNYKCISMQMNVL